MVQAHFRVQPRLIGLLGEQYHSTEEAIKELVANAWDADATRVEIVLPEPLTGDPITVRGNGYGMTHREVEDAYLNIAYNRRTRGDHTPRGRKVRGYRGIGKFAGLIAAQTMTVATESRDDRTRLTLDRAQFEEFQDDIEKAEIELATETRTGEDGTMVVLSGLRQTFALPTRSSLGRALLREFSRTDNFEIRINDIVTAADVLPGNPVAVDIQLPNGQFASCRVWFTDKSGTVADPGILIRVGARAIGLPTFFGLDRDPDVPKSLVDEEEVHGRPQPGSPSKTAHLVASVGSTVLDPSHDLLRTWLRDHWRRPTGKRSRETPAPLYRLRSALSRLWLAYPSLSSVFGRSG